MAEIEFLLPTVQYGNVKVRATPEELGIRDLSDSYEIGVAAAVYLNLFSQGFKHGSTLDVEAPQAPAQSEVDQVIDETLKAAQIIADGLGATEIHEDQSVVDPGEADDLPATPPWEKVSEEPVPGKPWENGGQAPAKVASINW